MAPPPRGLLFALENPGALVHCRPRARDLLRRAAWEKPTSPCATSPADAPKGSRGCSLPAGRVVEVLGWVDSQVTTLDRRLDKALRLRVDGEPRVLHVEFCFAEHSADGALREAPQTSSVGRRGSERAGEGASSSPALVMAAIDPWGHTLAEGAGEIPRRRRRAAPSAPRSSGSGSSRPREAGEDDHRAARPSLRAKDRASGRRPRKSERSSSARRADRRRSRWRMPCSILESDALMRWLAEPVPRS